MSAQEERRFWRLWTKGRYTGILTDAKLSAKQTRRLAKELEEIRAVGSAYTLGERLPGAGSLSAPVFNYDGAVNGSVNVLCLESRLNAKTVQEFRQLVQKTASDVSRELGWQAVETHRQSVNE